MEGELSYITIIKLSIKIKWGLTQQQIDERLGYVTNSYISDVGKKGILFLQEKN